MKPLQRKGLRDRLIAPEGVRYGDQICNQNSLHLKKMQGCFVCAANVKVDKSNVPFDKFSCY